MTLRIRLTAEEDARLDALVARTGRSKTFYVHRAIANHFDSEEESFWVDGATREWESSGRISRPAQTLWKELGLIFGLPSLP
ncbi:RHH-type rel operon transcriptional repressor/antitoxin RelB [Barrientosiimonas humi]|uniref:RHH-type rel operon transcriptional repressor/antitoxin RelB n=2 Tax=Barrientosiimonas TaxID=1535207 RepID=A0A542XGG3_9MICO|nr:MULTISPECIES: CopG family transcriptional regulator [Barrientosiimonas]TQL34913.1 RHH-type rel operon transcriptional repressor/antitoxin RelB [Barrientosiimonas humi]BDZ60066.1 hypothetical protein GCM10025872_37230 [Barrientosiimonas endolithica]